MRNEDIHTILAWYYVIFKKKQEYMYVCMRKKCDFLYNPIYAFLGIFSSNFFHKARFLGQNRRLEYS